MLAVNVPLINLLHDQMLLQHGGREGVVRASAVVEIVKAAPTTGATRPGRRSACEYAAHYLRALIVDAPFRDQVESTAWLVALYALGARGFTFIPRYGMEPVELVRDIVRDPDTWTVSAITSWFERRAQITSAQAAA